MACTCRWRGPPVFRHPQLPTGAELQVLLQQIFERVGCLFERRGIVERNTGMHRPRPPGSPVSAKPFTFGSMAG